MADAGAAVKKEWNFVSPKRSGQYLVKWLKIADQNRAIAKTISRANKSQNLPGGQNGFAFRVRAGHHAQASMLAPNSLTLPMRFQVTQRITVGETAVSGIPRKQFNF